MRQRFGVAGRRPLLLATLLAALVAAGPAVSSAHAVKLTFIGDSKAAMIEYSPPAKRLLAKGHTVRRDLKVCRRLVAQSCEYQGVRPLTALQATRKYGTRLGTVLVIDVGYNDSSATYRKQLDQVMLAARNRGVRGVVWVNLRAVPAHPDYKAINAIIMSAQKRWKMLYVANWNVYSRNKPASWFQDPSEGIHLRPAGAVGLVRLLRQWIPRAAEGPRETMLTRTSYGEPLVPGPSEQPAADEQPPAGPSTELTGYSPPVGNNLGGQNDGSTGLGGFLPFAGGAALMLFLILVTVKRRKPA
jgi:hypothetical protein